MNNELEMATSRIAAHAPPSMMEAEERWSAFMQTIRQELIAQQGRTRMACLESVILLDNPFLKPYATCGDRCKEHGFDTAKVAAHKAILNTISS
jgi:hypothetical protein